jgi:hypothetical protein
MNNKKDQIERKILYLRKLEERQSSAVPAKHAAYPEAYRRYIEHEIDLVKIQIEKVKLE